MWTNYTEFSKFDWGHFPHLVVRRSTLARLFLSYYSIKPDNNIIYRSIRSHLPSNICRTYNFDDGGGHDRGHVPSAHTDAPTSKSEGLTKPSTKQSTDRQHSAYISKSRCRCLLSTHLQNRINRLTLPGLVLTLPTDPPPYPRPLSRIRCRTP